MLLRLQSIDTAILQPQVHQISLELVGPDEATDPLGSHPAFRVAVNAVETGREENRIDGFRNRLLRVLPRQRRIKRN